MAFIFEVFKNRIGMRILKLFGITIVFFIHCGNSLGAPLSLCNHKQKLVKKSGPKITNPQHPISERCRQAELPYLTPWINGVKICELDTSKIIYPNYNKDVIADLLSRLGHISFKVLDNDPYMGKNRWGARSSVPLEKYFFKRNLDFV
jgi:hypothetical protein